MPRKSDGQPKISAPETITVRPEDLLVGMYVDLNCSWLKHPFPRRSFRIASQGQIRTICGLGLATVLVYPRESDPDTTIDTPSSPSILETTPESGPDTTLVDQAAANDAPLPTPSNYHQAGELASEAYRQVIQRSSQMMRGLVTGSPEGLRNAKVMINGRSTLLTNTEAAGMVASAFDPEDLDNLNH
ncbi:MAG: DUF3391 domain-containing protein [Nitrospira defluvii]|nr:DUF3391 domain-containing protein [Nitrospira defluvii]